MHTPRLTTPEMLAEEFAHVRGIPAPPPQAAYTTALDLQLNGLCFSGGGIRSAAFCLGVLQALARRNLLRSFDYLSTVSGGGFIGGWLQQLLRGEVEADAPDPEQRVALVEQCLHGHAPGPLNRLRDKTNYLTPKAGPASADTWAGVALYLRNMVLNWIIFLPVFLLIALLPILHRTLIWWAGKSMAASHAWSIGLLLVAMLLLGYGIFLTCEWLPSHRPTSQRIGPHNQRIYLRMIGRITLAALIWAMLLPISLQTLLTGVRFGPWFHPSLVIPTLYFVVAGSAYWLAARHWADDPAPDLFTVNRLHWGFATLGSALLLGALLHLLLSEGQWLDDNGLAADALTLLAPVVLLCTMLSQSTFYLGLRREALFGPLDREWLARLNGRILGIGTGWTVFAACCLLPSMITLPGGVSRPGNITLAAVGTMVSGFASSWLGKQMVSRVQALATDQTKTDQLIKLVQLILPLVFVVALFALLAALLQLGLGKFRPLLGAQPPDGTPDVVPILLQLALAALLLLLIWKLGRIVNVNRFSMHAVYRNRLIRAFLGTARRSRAPDPFTDFDDQDDPRLKEFRAAGGAGQRLFPVINTTLNITSGERDAWAERKGASFTATPLHCGSAALRPQSQQDIGDPVGAYVPTADFAGKESDQDARGEDEGTHLGSMMTVSGAAASPNWGYHSSPQIAFLMTLFNVRLGAWYPNPARATDADLRVAKPRNSLLALLYELAGRTTDHEQAVYLSDGGHFENLGVYEMLHRRCCRILVIDAGQDGGCTFFDLGMLIRKAEIDLPVRITMRTDRIAARSAIEAGHAGKACGFAHGSVSYLDADGRQVGSGEIIYIKPCLLPDSPAAVLAFAATSKSFPHESTGDQWFSESQFESYRTLGEFQGGRLTDLLPPAADGQPATQRLQALFAATRQYLDGAPPAVVDPACCV
jgi:hypothetical protein